MTTPDQEMTASTEFCTASSWKPFSEINGGKSGAKAERLSVAFEWFTFPKD